MSIDFRIAGIFQIFGCFGNVASVPKAPFISYSRIFYFGHTCPKLNFVVISRLTGKCATLNVKKTYAILVYGHGDIL